jgi:hypothetical protein
MVVEFAAEDLVKRMESASEKVAACTQVRERRRRPRHSNPVSAKPWYLED